MNLINNNKRGAALISSLFFLIIVTALATGAILLSTVQLKVSGSIARWESSYAAAEGAINYVIPLIQYAHFDHTIPQKFNAVVVDSQFLDELEISLNDADQEIDQPGSPSIPAAPDISLPHTNPALALGGFDVVIDIDGIGTTLMAGGAIEAAWAYHGTHSRSGIVKGFRVTATARTPSGSTRTRYNQVFWLKAGV